MPIELVIFDLAGTTVKDNKDVHRVLQHALLQEGISISLEEANAVMGIPKPIAIRQLLEKKYNGPKEITEDWIMHIHESFVKQMTDFYKHDPSVAECEGVSETFRKLKESKLKIAVDTGFDRLITQALLDRLGWEEQGLIDASVTSDEVLRGRPFPDMVFKAMEMTHVNDARSVAKVGDTSYDLQEGFSAGCGIIIGVTTGAFSREELTKEPHTHLIEKVPQIIEILNHH
jgi:phosphonatase-like hydrolase